VPLWRLFDEEGKKKNKPPTKKEKKINFILKTIFGGFCGG